MECGGAQARGERATQERKRPKEREKGEREL